MKRCDQCGTYLPVTEARLSLQVAVQRMVAGTVVERARRVQKRLYCHECSAAVLHALDMVIESQHPEGLVEPHCQRFL